jgi:hypothetical protein
MAHSTATFLPQQQRRRDWYSRSEPYCTVSRMFQDYRRGMATAASLYKHQRETRQIILGNVDHICTDGGIISSLITVQSCPNFLLMLPQQQATVNSSISGTIMSSKHILHQTNNTQQHVRCPKTTLTPFKQNLIRSIQ